MSVEYQCQDCRYHVYDGSTDTVPDPPLCGTCQTIRGAAPEDREALRKALHREWQEEKELK